MVDRTRTAADGRRTLKGTPMNAHTRREPLELGFGWLVYPVLGIVAVILALSLFGCSGSQVGPSWEKDPTGAVTSRSTDAPNRVSLSKAGETWDTESSVPGSYVEMFDENGNAVASLGPKSRVMIFPFFGKEAKIASDTDVTFTVKKAIMPDGTQLEGFTFSTLASPVVKAQNEVWDRLGPILIARDARAAETLLSDNEAVAKIVEAVGPGVIDVLKLIAGGF
jgi:hypothetical protein